MQTGENEQALRKITDFTRCLGISVLVLHFYFTCYGVFQHFNLTYAIVNRVLANVYQLPIFKSVWLTKSVALLFLLVSLIGSKGRKDENIKPGKALLYTLSGIALFYLSIYLFKIDQDHFMLSLAYIGMTSLGFLLLITGVSQAFRIIRLSMNKDIFNRENETFPQEERELENEFSINLPAQYQLRDKMRDSWINITNPFRGTLVMGSPGSGKSYFYVNNAIKQHIKKGFAMFIYDFKYDDLTRIAYNTLLNDSSGYTVKPKLFVINFEDLSRTHRCNPIIAHTMEELTDAMESSRTFMLGLNREWIKKQGDFFVESPINFVTALIWFLRKYNNGKFCSIPHAIELSQVDYKRLFSLLKMEPEIEVLINPFISAWQNEAYDQLEGQIASAKISMARLSSPTLYYVLSGNDFDLDINDPESPKIVCMGNNPQKQFVYGAVVSLLTSRALKMVNKPKQMKCSFFFDELPTIYLNNPDTIVATGRSNLVATTFVVQDYSQLKKDYGREQAEVLLNIPGNIIAGQVSGDTAKHLSERFGKIMQQRESLTINSTDTSINRSTQLDYAVPASRIATLSSGEFVGIVADDPKTRIDQKVFHSFIQNDHEAIKMEEAGYKPMPMIRHIDEDMVMANYQQIKKDIEYILASELKIYEPGINENAEENSTE